MRGELRETCERGLAALKDQPWVNAQAIGSMEQAFHAGSSAWSWSRIWSLVILGDYIERHGLK